MADIVDMRSRPRVTADFLLQKTLIGYIHRRLGSAHGEVAIDVSSVRFWARRFKSGKKDTGDWTRSASANSFTRPAYSVSREIEKVR